QEAHEAIRPAGAAFRHPKDVAGELGSDEQRLYEMIWQRTVACQMKDARGHRTVLGLGIDDAEFQATGKTVEFPGFRLAYVEAAEDADAALAEAERLLPNVAEGDTVRTVSVEASGHTTQPPARLTEASLIREMEALGIGRPSTYASIIETIQARDYVYKKGTALVPTFTAFAVTNLMDGHLSYLVDYAFTAKMENDLDEISNGSKDRLTYLRSFFHGNGNPGLDATIRKVAEEIDPRSVCSIPLGTNAEDTLVEVRVGRFGPFLSCGDQRVSVPDGTAPDELTLEVAIDLLEKGAQGPKSLGVDPETGLDIYVKTGRFGPYFQRGNAESLPDGEKPKMASLLRGMEPETVSLEEAIATLNLPRELGVKDTAGTDEQPGKPAKVLAANGRFGPYLKWDKETRSIPADESPLTITLERAMELFAQPKARGRQARAAPKVLKELGKHPETEAEIKILDGRYGPYCTDGTTNASLPKGESAEDCTLQHAIDLINARAAMGPSKGRRGAAKKKVAGGKSASKKSATAKAGKATKKKAGGRTNKQTSG
ncbi:MAG: DNA topoisomerase I, partial [Planctomycetes bacterium]|nr:DNA topoisomerase I [Planctomycetota bacterium]